MVRVNDEVAPKPEPKLASKTANHSPLPMKSEPQQVADMTPSLPPHMESLRSQTVEDTVKKMARTPLFMTSLEDAEADGT